LALTLTVSVPLPVKPSVSVAWTATVCAPGVAVQVAPTVPATVPARVGDRRQRDAGGAAGGHDQRPGRRLSVETVAIEELLAAVPCCRLKVAPLTTGTWVT